LLDTITSLSSFAFSALTLAFQLFTRKLCLHTTGLRMRNFTWNRFCVKNFSDGFLAYPHCGEYVLEYKYVQVWIIAKRW